MEFQHCRFSLNEFRFFDDINVNYIWLLNSLLIVTLFYSCCIFDVVGCQVIRIRSKHSTEIVSYLVERESDFYYVPIFTRFQW